MTLYLKICSISLATHIKKYQICRKIKLISRCRVITFNNFQLILLRGSSYQSIKEYQNKPLQEIMKIKIRHQIPNKESRKFLWIQFTELFQKSGFYEQIKQFGLAKQFNINIQKDILRTYKREEVKDKAREVLGVIAKFNPYIGYCQGMNLIIAFLIDDGFSCQQAFFIFKRISQILLPCDYYCSMDSIMAYMRIFYEMLNITHPLCYSKMKKISKQMDNSYMAMISFVLQWFVCLYTNQNVNIQITRLIWDFFLLEGITALFKAGLGMFDYLQQHIINCHSFQQYNQMQKKHIKNIKDTSSIRKRLVNTFISSQLLHILKQKLSHQDEKSKKQQGTKKTIKRQRNKKCNRKWNVCVQALEQNLATYKSYQFFVYKPKTDIKINENYLDRLDKIYFNQVQKPKDQKDRIIIGRISHICQPEEELLTEDSLSEKNPQSDKQKGKAFMKILTDPKSPIRVNQQMLRNKAVVKVQEVMRRKPGIQKSQSMIFMQNMVQNVSLSNLLELYEIDQLFQ